MKQLFYMPVNSYIFWGKTNTATVKRCLNQYGRHISAVAAVQDTRQNRLAKPIVASKKKENIYIPKRFSSYTPKGVILMDFDVWHHPKLFNALRSLYYFFFVLKGMDDSFSISEFNRSTITALQVVTTLLSELRFSELDGLLTQKCKEEVENNLKCWPKDQVSVLAVKPDKVIKVSPCDVILFSDENSEKVFVEIRVIHYVWMKYSSKFDKCGFHNMSFGKKVVNAFQQENFNNLYMCGVFNSKFIREFTEGVTDQWTINAINLKCYSDLLMAF